MNDLNRLHYTILSDPADAAAVRTALALTALATTTPGTGVATALAVNVGSAGAPVVNGGVLGTPTSGNLANCTGYPSAGITLMTPQTPGSTAINFTSIPSTAKQITITFNGVSTNGSDFMLVQLGDSGGIEATGYSGSANTALFTDGFSDGYGDAAAVRHGALILTLLESSTNTWACCGVIGRSDSAPSAPGTAGTKSLSGVLDRITITTRNGVNTFDASGTVNVSYL